MARLAWYAGASTALAATVVASAFHQRANFYSAMVHLAQSSLSLMIIVNLVFLVYGSFMYGLQRLCYGQLRPVEIEQLYEKAWFAVTETCLAMTIFREEVGAFFLVMFTALVTGKVWGWIGEGRVEVLEQQPPANPRLFHIRLSISLLVSVLYGCWLLHYTVWTVVQQARPTMMVMFLFEFAVLTVSSYQTAARYIISLVEQRVVKNQTAQRLADRRKQIREQRAEILRRRETEGVAEPEGETQGPLPNEEDVDEMDIEVPGWEEKGQWILSLDLVADFLKLTIYSGFFCVLFTFYGLPIHIMRDLFMTTRSFVKRLGALLRYRQAVKDMNKYPDATAQDLLSEDTCIICREEMKPWDPTNTDMVERHRPKKLPCGHILHFGCLKSWLERQQVCPTCRRSVVMDAPAPARNEAMVFRLGLNFPNAGGDQQPPANGGAVPGAGQGAAGNAGQNNQPNGPHGGGVRMFNLGPLRLGFAQGGVQNIQEMAQRLGMPANVADPPLGTPAPQRPTDTPTDTTELLGNINAQLNEIHHRVVEAGQRVQQDLHSLQTAEVQVNTLNYLLHEATRLHHLQNPPQQLHGMATGPTPVVAARQVAPFPQGPQPLPAFQPPGAVPQRLLLPHHYLPNPARLNPPPTLTRHGGADYTNAIPAGSPDLPEGVVIPPGWSLLPLQRLDQGAAGPVAAGPASGRPATPLQQAQAPTASSHSLPEMLQNLTQQPGQQPSPPRPVPTDAAGPSSTTTASSERGRSEARQRPSGTNDASAQSIDPASRGSDEPPVTAPTPVMPSWGGAAQLFGAGPREDSEGGQQHVGAQPVPGPAHEDGGHNGNESEEFRGKARAVTVEEATGDDDRD